MTKRKSILIALASLALIAAVGANPRYIEELRIGGGYQDADGGVDIDKTGNIVSSATATVNVLSVTGDATIGGTLTAGSISGAFVKADIDTEAELETTLTDVSNVFTNNDTVPDENLASTIHRDTENKDIQYVGNAGNSVHLDDVGSSNSTSGASLIGVYDEFFAGNPTNVQDALDDIDARLYQADWVTADYLADTLTLDAILAINGYDVKIGSNLWVGNSGANGTIYFGDGNQSIIFDSGDNRFELNKSLYTGSSLLCSAPIYIGENDVVDDYLYIGGGYWKWDETYSQLTTSAATYLGGTNRLIGNIILGTNTTVTLGTNTTFTNDAKLNDDIVIGLGASNDDDTVYFDDGSTEYIRWDDDPGEFDISDDINVTGGATLADKLSISNAEAANYTGIDIENTETSSKKFALYVNSDSTTYGIPKAFIIRDMTAGANKILIDPTSGVVGINISGTSTISTGIMPSNNALYVDGSTELCGWLMTEGIFLRQSTDDGGIMDHGSFFVDDTYEVFVRDGLGNATQISNHGGYREDFQPQADDPFPFVYRSENPYLGKRVEIDLSGLLREVEKITGKSFIKYTDIPAKVPDRELPEWMEERLPVKEGKP